MRNLAKRTGGPAFIALYLLCQLAGKSGPAQPAPSQQVKPNTPSQVLSDYTISANDIQESIRITQSDTKELAKIGADFSTTYSIPNLSLLYKQPDKLRLEGKSATRGPALMILNGTNRYVDIPRFKIHVTENLEKSPSRRQSLLELGGVISPQTLSFMSGKYLRPETLDGHATLVFDMHYSGMPTGQSYRLWVDSATHTTVKREWYGADSQLKATFLYDQPQQVSPGVWLPTRVQIKNAEGVLAAVLELDNIKVNQGLIDSLFTIPS